MGSSYNFYLTTNINIGYYSYNINIIQRLNHAQMHNCNGISNDIFIEETKKYAK